MLHFGGSVAAASSSSSLSSPTSAALRLPPIHATIRDHEVSN
jgi:hypothetical protein